MIISRELNRFTNEHIDKIQEILLYFTYKTEEEKMKHIQNVQNYKK